MSADNPTVPPAVSPKPAIPTDPHAPPNPPAPPMNPPTDLPPSDPKPIDGSGDGTAADLQARYVKAVAEHEAKTLQLQMQNKELADKLANLEGQINGWKQDPYAAVNDLGGTREEFVQRLLNDDQPTVESEVGQLRQELQTVKQQLADRSKTDQEREEEARKNAYYAGQAQEVKTLSSTSEDYADINLALEVEQELFGSNPDHVLTNMIRGPFERQVQSTGRGLTPAESAGMILKEAQLMLSKIRQSKALRKVLELETKQSAVPPSSSPPQRTLTNQMGTSSDQADPSKMSDSEWIAYATRKARLPDKQ